MVEVKFIFSVRVYKDVPAAAVSRGSDGGGLAWCARHEVHTMACMQINSAVAHQCKTSGSLQKAAMASRE